MDLKSKGKSNSALNSYIFAFRMIGKYLEHKEEENPFTKVKSLPKEETVINPLTTEEIMKLITCEIPYGLFHGKDLTKEANALYTSMLVFLSFTGARYDEMASLKVQDVDIENRVATFYHTKNQKPHRIKIPPMVMKYLVPHTYLKTPKSYLFESVSHGKVCSQNFSFNVRKRAKMCGITKPVNPHNFRHSYGTEMRRGGMKIEDIARLLNHKDIQTTFKYYDHVQAEELEKETIRHPLIRDSAKPEDIFKLVKEAIQSFNLDHDARFEASYSDTELVVRLRT